jgi:hypothetical protein
MARWGLALAAVRATRRERAAARRRPVIGVASVLETRRTGRTIGGVPEHLVRLRIEADGRPDSLLSLCLPLTSEEAGAVVPGAPFPVRFAPGDQSAPELIDAADPAVRTLLLRRRIAQGLVPAELVAARTRGVLAPARVLRSRPTGLRLHGQIEVAVAVRVQPSGGDSPWEADTRVFMHPQSVRHLAPGARVAARYEPTAPFVVALTIEDPTAAS